MLYALKDNNIAILESLERPEGVISKYKELLRTAAKDETILSNLEGQLSFYNLEMPKYRSLAINNKPFFRSFTSSQLIN